MQEHATQAPLGDAIRIARLVRNVSVGELSARTGVSARRITAFEHGRSVPLAGEFVRLWEYLTSDPPPEGAGQEHT